MSWLGRSAALAAAATLLACTATLLASATAFAQAGARVERTFGGFWLSAEYGLGFATIDCAACPGTRLPDDPWEGGAGMATALAVGGTPRADLELGGEFAYFRGFQEQGRRAEVSYVGATARFQPAAIAPLSVRAGVGLGTLDLRGADAVPARQVTEQTVALRAGAGYDVRVGRGLALVPTVGVTALFTAADAEARNPLYLYAALGLTRR